MNDLLQLAPVLGLIGMYSGFNFFHSRSIVKQIKVSRLFIHPIKSCKAIELKECEITPYGLKGDRDWMLVYADSKNFITQRQDPRMCLIETMIIDGDLYVEVPGKMDRLKIGKPEDYKNAAEITVDIWGANPTAKDCGDIVSNWFSSYLGRNVRLVTVFSNFQRFKEVSDEKPGIHFQDGYPFLLASESSLTDLQSVVETRKLDIGTFRPNIVVRGGDAYEEDIWDDILINNIRMKNVKPCTRCTIPNVDQNTAKVYDEPRETLRATRTIVMDDSQQQIWAVNLVHKDLSGTIRVGDVLKVESFKDLPKFVEYTQ